MPSNNNKEDICPKAFNNGNKGIRLGSGNTTANNNGDVRLQQRPTTADLTSQNKLLSELSWNFGAVMFGKSEYLIDTSVSDTRYEHPGTPNNNPIYLFKDQLDYVLAY